MARRPRKRLRAEIETGSFSDISFLLIIFFVLTTTFAKTTGRTVDLPSASPPEREASEEKRPPSVRVFADRVLFDAEGGEDAGRDVTVAELKAGLLALGLSARPENARAVVVETADDVTWDRYFKVVSAVSEAGGVVAVVEEGG